MSPCVALPSGQKIGQGSGSIGQMGRGFPGGLKQAIPYPFNKIFINSHMTTMHSAVIHHSLNLKFTRIIHRRTKTRIRYGIPRKTNRVSVNWHEKQDVGASHLATLTEMKQLPPMIQPEGASPLGSQFTQ